MSDAPQPRIIYIPGLLPKPEPGVHRDALLRCLLAGVGRMLFEAITARDFPIIQGFTVVIAVGYVLLNIVVDISYVFIDPRIRLE